jgi:hypothetical protein
LHPTLSLSEFPNLNQKSRTPKEKGQNTTIRVAADL